MSEALAKNLKKYLDNQGIGMVTFAQRAGVGSATIHEIVSGKASPTLKTLEKIATAMGVTVNDLLKEE